MAQLLKPRLTTKLKECVKAKSIAHIQQGGFAELKVRKSWQWLPQGSVEDMDIDEPY